MTSVAEQQHDSFSADQGQPRSPHSSVRNRARPCKSTRSRSNRWTALRSRTFLQLLAVVTPEQRDVVLSSRAHRLKRAFSRANQGFSYGTLLPPVHAGGFGDSTSSQ